MGYQVTTVLLVVAVCSLPSVWSAVCSTTTYVSTTAYKRNSYSCGWWGWSTCYRAGAFTRNTPVTVNECCTGDYGHVENGCNGECPYESAQSSADCNGGICRDFKCDRSGVQSSFTSFNVHENSNAAQSLFNVNATCFVQFSCPDCACTCSRKRRSLLSDVSDAVAKVKRSTCSCSANEPCTTCTVSNTHLFEVRNGVQVWRKACNSECNDCTGVSGCLSADDAINDVTVTCSGSGNGDNDAVTTTFSVNVEAEDEPGFTDSDPIVAVIAGSMTVGSVVAEIPVTFDSNTGDVTYTLGGATSPFSNKELFEIDENDAGKVKVAQDLSTEPTHTYTLEYCVITRRHTVCKNINVTLITITTTTPPTTTTPVPPTYCRAVGAWNFSRAMDSWCEMVCLHSTPFCPGTHCVCGPDLPPGRSVCTPSPDYSTVVGMDRWCDWNCNTEYPVECRPELCTCDPVVQWDVTAPWQK